MKKKKCEMCGKEIESGLEGFPPKNQRWCTDCVTTGLEWGMERYTDAMIDRQIEREAHE